MGTPPPRQPSRPSPPHRRSSRPLGSPLFDDEPTQAPKPPPTVKPFVEYLRTTPPSPLSGFTKLILWVTVVVVALLFLAAVIK